MSKTYPELKTEIARLKAEAERVRRLELPGVIDELNQLIERYELTEAMIFGVKHKETWGRPRTVLIPKYFDQTTGNTWTGRGPKPVWVSKSLDAGTLVENLLIS